MKDFDTIHYLVVFIDLEREILLTSPLGRYFALIGQKMRTVVLTRNSVLNHRAPRVANRPLSSEISVLFMDLHG